MLMIHKMFITEVMEKLWSPKSEQYKIEYDKAMEFELDSLNNKVLDAIKNIPEKFYFFASPQLSATMLANIGCSHQKKGHQFAGCSMCDYYSTNMQGLAQINALKDRDLELYKKAVVYSFMNSRGSNIVGSQIETVTTYNFLDEESFPEDLLGEIFGKDKLYSRRPIYFKFETRPSMVTKEKLLRLKKYIGNRVIVSMGIETGNEQLRNHWFNKNTTNQQITDAVKIIKEVGWRVTGNLLIGMPGLTEQHIISTFKESVNWLLSLGVDEIVCSPIVLKPCTLQNFLNEQLSDNVLLNKYGLVQGKHTGMPHIFTVLRALYPFLTAAPEISSKVAPSAFHFPIYETMVKNEYANDSEAFTAIMQAYEQYRNGDKNALLLLEKYADETNWSDSYKSLLVTQQKITNISESLYLTASVIGKNLWPNSWEKRVDNFQKEIVL